MQPELVWAGKLTGVLVPTFGDLVHVHQAADGPGEVPLRNVALSLPPDVKVDVLRPEAGPTRLQIKPRSPFDPVPAVVRKADVLVAEFVAPALDSVFFADPDGDWEPRFVRWSVADGRLDVHARMWDNNQFSRAFAMGSRGEIVTASGMGGEIIEPEGYQVGGDGHYAIDHVGSPVAVGPDFIVVGNYAFGDHVAVHGPSGAHRADLTELFIDGRRHSLRPHGERALLTNSLHADANGRVWGVFSTIGTANSLVLVVFTPSGQVLAAVSELDLPFPRTAPGHRVLGAIGVDRRGRLWFDHNDGTTYALAIPGLSDFGLAPALSHDTHVELGPDAWAPTLTSKTGRPSP